MIKELNLQNFDETITSDKPVVVEFYSPTCVHCKKTEVGLNELSEENTGIAIYAKVDITTQTELAQRYDVQSLPTVAFIKNGELKDLHTGFTHKLIIEEGIKKLL